MAKGLGAVNRKGRMIEATLMGIQSPCRTHSSSRRTPSDRRSSDRRSRSTVVDRLFKRRSANDARRDTAVEPASPAATGAETGDRLGRRGGANAVSTAVFALSGAGGVRVGVVGTGHAYSVDGETHGWVLHVVLVGLEVGTQLNCWRHGGCLELGLSLGLVGLTAWTRAVASGARVLVFRGRAHSWM
eukprot:2755533-Prymnesium_polylepis.3